MQGHSIRLMDVHNIWIERLDDLSNLLRRSEPIERVPESKVNVGRLTWLERLQRIVYNQMDRTGA